MTDSPQAREQQAYEQGYARAKHDLDNEMRELVADGLVVERRLQQATEALREAEADLERIAEWSLHRAAKPPKAREAELALERVRSTLAALAGEDDGPA